MAIDRSGRLRLRRNGLVAVEFQLKFNVEGVLMI